MSPDLHANDNDPGIEASPLSSWFSRDGISVEVKITRPALSDLPWTLEVIAANGASHVWSDRFSTGSEAYRTFYLMVEHQGIGSF